MNLPGYIPPQATEIEASLLGTILISGANIDLELFEPSVFYKNENKIIAETIAKMVAENQNIDILTVSENLQKDGLLEQVGGKDYLTQLINKIEASGDVNSYEKILYEKYMLRELIRISNEISKKAYQNEDPFDLTSELQTLTASLLGFKSDSIRTIKEGVKSLRKLIDRNLSGTQKLTGLPTGLVDLDRFTNGLQKTDLIVIGGEPSNGKTSLAMKIALSAAKFNHPVVIYSYEMSEIQLAARLTAMETGFSAKKMQYRRLKDFELSQVDAGFGKIESLPIYIDSIPDSSFDYLEKSIRVMVQKNRMELVIIDYLQLIRHSIKSGNHAEAVAEIANRLKALAKVLNVPIVLVSQLARDKNNPKPTIGRLKGSGDIEAAADLILLPYRAEFYGKQTFECKMETYPSEGLALLMIAKGRNIGTTEMVLEFEGKTTLFKDYEGDNGAVPY